MNDLVWIAGIIFLIVPGLASWRLPFVRRLDLAARLAIAFACGVAIAAVLMYAYSLAHVPWGRATIGIPLLVIGAWGWSTGWSPGFSRSGPAKAGAPFVSIGLFLLFTLYGVATARETCGDLIYFWGPKGQRFYDAGSIDLAFLGFPHYYLMHRDYPPLVPLTYAWASQVAHRFSWWGALYLMPIALAATALAFRGLARETLGDQRAGWYAALLAAILAYGFAVGMVGGAAEPLLLLFEVIAVAALTFHPDDRGAQIVAAIALACVAFSKVEGAVFVIIAVIAWALVTRRLRRPIAIAIPAAVLLGSWIVFMGHHKLLDQYGRGGQPMHFNFLGATLSATLRQASYESLYVPWIAAVAPLAVSRNVRRAAFPLLVAAGSIASTIFFYLHTDHPEWWIDASAMRVLLTPLACLAVASAAASE